MESLRQLSEDSSAEDVVFDDIYELGNLIHRGLYSSVYCCVHRSTANVFAVKVTNVDKYSRYTGLTVEDIKNEATICHTLKHRHIVELLETYCSDGLVYMVFEYMDGKDILSEIVHRSSVGFAYSEAVASHYMRQLLEAVCYWHSLDVVHRRLGPQCVLLASASDNSAPIKVAGFSRAVRLPSQQHQQQQQSVDTGTIGVQHYMAPEIRSHQVYGKPADVWSCGALLHALLTGAPPTVCDINKMVGGGGGGGVSVCDQVSESARDLLQRLLCKAPAQRVTAAEALKHVWIQKRGCCADAGHLSLTVARLSVHNTYRRLARSVISAICDQPCQSSQLAHSPPAHSTRSNDSCEDVTLNGVLQIARAMDHLQQLLLSSDTAAVCQLTSDMRLQQLLALFDKISNCRKMGMSIQPAAGALQCFADARAAVAPLLGTAAGTLSRDIGSGSSSSSYSPGVSVARQFCELTMKPHFQALLRTHEVLCDRLYGDQLVGVSPPPPLDPPLPCGPADMATPSHVTRVRLVQFQKSTDEPMGITLRMSDDGRCLVARIMHGGMIHRQATLHVGDEIREINGVPVLNQNVDALQKILRESRGSVTFKIVPSQQTELDTYEVSSQVFLRAQFDYNPQEDSLIPCAQAGIQFHTGDILQIISRQDQHWWQARLHDSPALAGLIPSPQLQEHRAAASNSSSGTSSAAAAASTDRTKQQQQQQQQQVHCSIFGKRKRLFKEKNSSKNQSIFDILELNTYEEVVRMKTFRRRTLVLLGAHGVGRRHIKNVLISSHPDKFAYPIPHTTRAPRPDEENGKQYHFVSHDQMMSDIAANEYLEYGTHDDAMYGTKLDTIRRIQLGGRMAILDVEPQALRVLRCAEHSPFVVFIAAPSLQLATDYDGSLERLGRESAALQRAYGHCFDLTIVNDDIDTTVSRLEQHVLALDGQPQWVPVAWVY